MVVIAILIVASGICTVVARQMAQNRGWSPGLWGLLAAFLGPIPLVALVFTPKSRDQDA
jgi:hypothetical protein